MLRKIQVAARQICHPWLSESCSGNRNLELKPLSWSHGKTNDADFIFKMVFLLLLLGLTSCTLSSHEPRLEMLAPDTVRVDQKVLVRIYSLEPEWKVTKAYFDCTKRPKPDLVNVQNETIEGCSKTLFVEQDTILIEFTPTKVGKIKFPEIKVLLRKDANYFNVIETGFEYFVLGGKGNSVSENEKLD